MKKEETATGIMHRTARGEKALPVYQEREAVRFSLCRKAEKQKFRDKHPTVKTKRPEKNKA